MPFSCLGRPDFDRRFTPTANRPLVVSRVFRAHRAGVTVTNAVLLAEILLNALLYAATRIRLVIIL